ncbi:MAG: tetratricopeptide repeat protein [Longimicrobiaceae bacterium]
MPSSNRVHLFRRWASRWGDAVFTGLLVAVGLGTGLGIVLAHGAAGRSTALLWSFACFSSGMAVGFLFGIPRVLQGDVPVDPSQPGGAQGARDAAGQEDGYRIRPNTNLEQISDWLTKILVGVGLVQMGKIGDALDRASLFLARGLGAPAESLQVFAAGIIVYFTVSGFMGGYLTTRLFLTGAFSRADRAAAAQPTLAEYSAVREASIEIVDRGGAVSGEAVQAASRIGAVPVDQLRTPEALAVWAKAQLIEGNTQAAVDAYARAVAGAPGDVALRYEYAVALFQAGRPEETVRELQEAYRRITPATDRVLKEKVYNSLTFTSLYLPPPGGFTAAVRYGEEYVANPANLPSGSIWVNLAAAYGQRARWLGEQPARDSAAVAAARGLALRAVHEALRIDPRWRERLVMLLDPAFPGKDPAEDDLEVFAGDPEFRDALGLPELPRLE